MADMDVLETARELANSLKMPVEFVSIMGHNA